MSKSRCPRSFEAEASRDGRLGADERASFEAHAEKCADCTKAIRELDALGARLRSAPVPRADDLQARRERTRLLSDFNRGLVEPRKKSRAQLFALVPIAALVVGIAFALHRVGRGVAADASVSPEPGTEWSSKVDGEHTVIELDRGTLAIVVSHGPGARPVVVHLPDGELEDTGTTFEVSVENGHTSRVSVDEGAVVLRLNGRQPVALAAGGAWNAPPPSFVAAPASATSSTVAPESTTKSADAGAAPATSTSPAIARATGSTSADEFNDATLALDRGDACDAAGRFGRFLAAHPSDAHEEDAAYLHVIALQRCGDAAATKEAARDYLARFPHGFRRSELEPLAR